MPSNINIMREYGVQESSLLSIKGPKRFLKTHSPEGFMKYIKLPSVLLFFHLVGQWGQTEEQAPSTSPPGLLLA